MCGFVGYRNSTLTASSGKGVIKSMAEAIKHRGPDDESYFTDESLTLSFRRLSIIDIEHGKQPMIDSKNDRVLMFNGEIYNYKEIRSFLQEKGYLFLTESDTEILLHGYDYFREELLSHLRGMFAFVIWDRKTKKIFGARDQFGIKPLYYYHKDQNFLFGSEIKALLLHPGLEKEFNEEVLSEYLSMEYTTDETTFFKNIYKVLPGNYFIYDVETDHYDEKRYFSHSYALKEESFEESVNGIEKIVEDSVAAHLISDVEVGSFLSSGVDSSYVLKTASERQPIASFSVGYEEEKYSELSYSDAFSENIQVENTCSKISADDFMEAVPMVQYHMDEPLSNPSAVPLYYLAQMASKQVKVVLSGEGADELFGGYNQYLESIPYSKYEKIPKGVRKGIANFARKMPEMKGKRFFIRGALPLKDRYFRIDYVFSFNEREQLLKDKHLNKNHFFKTHHLFHQCDANDQIHQMMSFDFHTWLPYDILLKADRMSMAHSLELRVPLMDKEVMKVVNSLTKEKLVKSNETKVALREAAKRKIESHVADKPKLGFPSPLTDWIKKEPIKGKISAAFRSDFAKKYFDQLYLHQLLESHCTGKKTNMRKIWSIYSLVVWYDQYFA